jgi:Transposase IS4
MLCLKLVKAAEEEASNQEDANQEHLPHGAQVLKSLVSPWSNSDHIVCADSYFALVTAAVELKKIGLRFIGVVKTGTRRFPMAYLQGLELQKRGDRKGLIMQPVAGGDPSLLLFMWMDRERRYFIASAASLKDGAAYSRTRWRQVEDGVLPETVDQEVPQPLAAEIYNDTCGRIDQSNRHCHATLKLERKFTAHNWSDRVNHSIFGMGVVDTGLVYSQCTHTEEQQSEFYEDLALELINNTFDQRPGGSSGTRRSFDSSLTSTPGSFETHTGAMVDVSGRGRSGIGAHLTPSKRHQ